MSRAENPGLRVALSVNRNHDAHADDSVAVRVDVADAVNPLRVSIYVDGDLVDTWLPTGDQACQFTVPGLHGRRLFTARAVDAHGRWGGASALVNLPAALPV